MVLKLKFVVKNIDWNCSQSELYNLFSKYGNIKSFIFKSGKKNKKPNYCFLTFDNENDFNNILKKKIIINNRKLLIQKYNFNTEIKNNNNVKSNNYLDQNISKWQKMIEENKIDNNIVISDKINWQQKLLLNNFTNNEEEYQVEQESRFNISRRFSNNRTKDNISKNNNLQDENNKLKKEIVLLKNILDRNNNMIRRF